MIVGGGGRPNDEAGTGQQRTQTLNRLDSGRPNDEAGTGQQRTRILKATRDRIQSEVDELEGELQRIRLQTTAATQRKETRSDIEAQLTTAKDLENQRATELAAAQTILHATELLVTSAQRRTVEIATSLSVWQGELKEVQEDETRNNLKMKEQSELVLAMRQSGPPGWHWQAPANKSTESGAAARDS
jgi:hypothetical protein